MVYYHQNRFNEAHGCFTKCISNKYMESHCMHMIGLMCIGHPDHDFKAEDIFSKLISTPAKNNLAYYFNLCQIHLRKGNMEKAWELMTYMDKHKIGDNEYNDIYAFEHNLNVSITKYEIEHLRCQLYLYGMEFDEADAHFQKHSYLLQSSVKSILM